MRARLIIISNERNDGDAPGQIHSFKLLVESNFLESVKVFYPSNQSRPHEHKYLIEEVKKGKHDFLLVLSPGSYPIQKIQFEDLLISNGKKPIIYWEGDAWGQKNSHFLSARKPITEQMKWWLAASSIVFTHSGKPQTTEFELFGAKKVIHIPQTYCHIQFYDAENFCPVQKFANDGVLIGSNLSRIPGLTGLPGSSSRFELAYKLKFKYGASFEIYGKNWIPKISEGPIPYNKQSEKIRDFRVSVNWDHFPEYENYTSDRFPIALVSGRAHLTTLHPNSPVLPGEELGIFRAKTVEAAINLYSEILDLGDAKLHALGVEAWKWSRFRLSHRKAAQFIMSQVTSDVPRVHEEPWNASK
jgi:hypothetical protein